MTEELLTIVIDCEACKEWGRTITRADHPNAVACSVCKRLTWPNLGVNLPAGCAVALATSRAVDQLRLWALLAGGDGDA